MMSLSGDNMLKKGERFADCQQVIGESDSCLFQIVVIERGDDVTPLVPTYNLPPMNRAMQLRRSTHHGNEVSHRCEGCDIKHGGVHHYGCPMERCPHCGERILYCSCKKVELQIGTRRLDVVGR